ncbi:hypothetical protein LR032_06475, partial [Candidatus Bipolaricaulota bacterium]|nr:hypothetical protein [Candidatus Bipolaricaulota bacterium]
HSSNNPCVSVSIRGSFLPGRGSGMGLLNTHPQIADLFFAIIRCLSENQGSLRLGRWFPLVSRFLASRPTYILFYDKKNTPRDHGNIRVVFARVNGEGADFTG